MEDRNKALESFSTYGRGFLGSPLLRTETLKSEARNSLTTAEPRFPLPCVRLCRLALIVQLPQSATQCLADAARIAVEEISWAKSSAKDTLFLGATYTSNDDVFNHSHVFRARPAGNCKGDDSDGSSKQYR